MLCPPSNRRFGPGPDSCTATNPPSSGCTYLREGCLLRSPVDSYPHLHCMTMHDGAYCGLSNRLEVRMMPNSRNLVLSKSQAARLIALRDSENVKTDIVIQAALDLVKTKVKTRDG